MAPAAKVTSIEDLQAFKASLGEFGEDAKEALGANAMELQRTFAWLQEQGQHWQREIRVRQEEFVVAKNNLNRRKMSKVMGRTPDCSEQEEAFELAQRRLRHAEEKLENCKRWGTRLRRVVDEYEGPARQLNGFLDVELARALALLERKIDALVAYLEVAPPTAPAPTVGLGTSSDPSMIESMAAAAVSEPLPAEPEAVASVTAAPAEDSQKTEKG